MARQEVDIGIVGNDGTGDSIREAFRKVNDNFREIYAVFGQGDTIRLQDLGNVPDELGPNRILTTDVTGIDIQDRILEGGAGIEVDAASDPNKIIISASGTSLSSDTNPQLAGPMNANGFLIANNSDPNDTAVENFNIIYNANITQADVVINKGYADRHYIRKSGGSTSGSGQIRVRNEPLNKNEYTITISSFSDGNAVVFNHGFDSGIDGASFVYNTDGALPNNIFSTLDVTSSNFVIGNSYKIETLGNTDYTLIGAQRNVVGEIFTLTNKTSIGPSSTGTVKAVYYIKYVNSNQLSFHSSFQNAQSGISKIVVSGGSGTKTLTDAYLNNDLEGNWISNEVLPRASVVRRQGDTMTGVLNLADHPFPLQGSGTPNRPDDLQAATKFYVDNSSFTSQVDLYVSTNGKDIQLDTPPGKEGRAWAYAYSSVGRACEKAEYILNNADYETGPYRQLIAINDGAGFSVVTDYTSPGVNGIARIKFSNNAGSKVDQGSTGNVDITPGKLLKGRVSGATGFIYKYYGPDQFSSIGEDYIDLQYVKGEFIPGENLEFGDAVKNVHITIFVESGIYEEDYPIKIPPNTAIVGDEFRRVLIRPKDRVSQSPWVDTWFFRNSLFDGLNVTSGGTQFDSTLIGWYGYHYLKKPNLPINRGVIYNNEGGFSTEAQAILDNKIDIQNAIVTYLNDLGPTLTSIEETKCARDVGYILDAIIYDLEEGGMEKILNIQDIFSEVTTLSPECKSGIGQIDDYINDNVIAGSSQDIKDLITAMIDKVLFGFDDDYNTPKNNKDMDVFLCNDSTIVRQVTCQGHGGFMMVLDPEGQILTKSPYCQQSGSFSGSLNKKAFRGGQYIDGFSGNLTPNVVTKHNSTSLTITDIPRAPQIPTSFFISGQRYKVDSFVPHAAGRPNAGDLLIANKNFIQSQAISHINTEYAGVKYPYAEIEKLINKLVVGLSFDLTYGGNSKTIETTKRFFNRSSNLLRFNSNLAALLDTMLGYIKTISIDIVTNDIVDVNQATYTQIIDADRPGEAGSSTALNLLMNNLILCVSNGIENIDDLDNPSFKLILDSETPLPSNLTPTEITLITPGNTSMLSNDFTQVNDLGYGIVTNNNGLAECVSVFSYYCWTSMFSNNGGQMRSLNSSSANGEYGLVAAGSDPLEVPDSVILADNTVQVATIVKTGDYIDSAKEKDLFIYVTGFQYVPYNVSIVEINHGAVEGILRYEMNNSQVVEVDGNGDPLVVKLNFNTAGNNDTSTSGLKTDLADGDKIIIRSGQNFKFNNVLDTNPVRPSTALTFEGDPIDDVTAPVYRVISYNTKGPANETLDPAQSILTFDTTYAYIPLIVDYNKINEVDPDNPAKTLGATAGDVKVAIKTINDVKAIARLNTGEMLTAWDGKIHRVTGYTGIIVDNYAYVELVDTDINGDPLPYIDSLAAGLYSSLDPSINLTLKADSDIVLRAGLASGEPANITVRISTMRATGHDFLDVGTGGYNTSNYPSKIYGAPKSPNQAREVEERTRGRVFYVSTDQDGFFRVGRFFTVDQGTGTVTFAASIALSNLDGIGFKRGIAIAEFSSDDKFTDLSQDTVPTEAAIGTYIDRRLGITRQGIQLDLTEVFEDAPGFIDRLGVNYPLNDIDWGDNKIINLKAPTGVKDAVNKNYVDVEVSKFDALQKLNDTIVDTPSSGHILAFIGSLNAAVNAEIVGDLSGTFQSTATTTLASPIGALGSVTSISVADATNFPTNGYVLISNTEIFKYSSRTLGGSQQLNGVIRLSISTDNDTKFYSTLPQAHIVGADVVCLNSSQIDYQIRAGVIVNADVNASAGIVQSKLDLQKASTFPEADALLGWTKPDKSQSDLGLATFSDLNFDSTQGFIRIKQYGIARAEQELVDPDRILGNLGASADHPQQIAPEDLLKRATWNALNSTSTISRDHVYTFRAQSNEASSSFITTEINVNITNNSIVKRTASGFIKTNGVNNDSDISVISINNSANDAALPVTYKGQWSPGANASFTATYANDAATANYATTAGTITNQANSATITATVSNLADTIVLRDADGVINATATQARYADLAEWYTSDQKYEPGTVLVFGGDYETTVTRTFGDSRVAGVVTTKPAYIMNTELGNSNNAVCVALQGRVPCKVVGKVKKGDLLTTSASPGYAIKAINPTIGTIIGKALENKDTSELGIIEIAVGRF